MSEYDLDTVATGIGSSLIFTGSPADFILIAILFAARSKRMAAENRNLRKKFSNSARQLHDVCTFPGPVREACPLVSCRCVPILKEFGLFHVALLFPGENPVTGSPDS